MGASLAQTSLVMFGADFKTLVVLKGPLGFWFHKNYNITNIFLTYIVMVKW